MKCSHVLSVLLAVGIVGCDRSSNDERDTVLNADGEFAVSWPPGDLGRRPGESYEPLLNGKLSVFRTETHEPSEFRMYVTLQRPDGEADRARWNKKLAFPEYSWMARVRVWDGDHQWLWPNLPYLLRAHGEEREQRYGGVDPGKGVDNDFAAILIRPLDYSPLRAGERERVDSMPPLVSAEWYPVGVENPDKNSVVHIARSDEFSVRVLPSGTGPHSGKLGVWLIYADFLGASVPAAWPSKKEYAGGILAYLEVAWQRNSDGDFKFEINHLVPPTDTGFDWEHWSTGSSALQKNQKITLPPQTLTDTHATSASH